MAQAGIAAGTAVAARIASAVAIAHNSVSEARAEALNEPNEHLRNEKTNLLDNVDHGISTFEKAYAIGQKAEGILANDSLEASTVSDMRDILKLTSNMVNSTMKNVQKNVQRVEEIEPGALGFVIPHDPHDFVSIEYSDDNDNDKEDSNVNENKNDEKEEKMGQLLNDNNENDNNKQGMMMMVIGEKDDYVSDSDSNDNGNNNDVMLKDNNDNNNVNGKKKNKKRRVIVYYKDEGKLRKTPEYSKFAVILSAFFLCWICYFKTIKKSINN